MVVGDYPDHLAAINDAVVGSRQEPQGRRPTTTTCRKDVRRTPTANIHIQLGADYASARPSNDSDSRLIVAEAYGRGKSLVTERSPLVLLCV